MTWRGTNALVKFLSLGLIATLFYAMGGRIHVLAIPLFGQVQLASTVSFVVTVLWLVGIANAFNLIRWHGWSGVRGRALFIDVILIVSLGATVL